MDFPRQTPGALTQRISVSKKDYSTCNTSMVEDLKPKHNFMGGSRDPKILRKSDQRITSKRQLVEKPELMVDRRTSHH